MRKNTNTQMIHAALQGWDILDSKKCKEYLVSALQTLRRCRRFVLKETAFRQVTRCWCHTTFSFPNYNNTARRSIDTLAFSVWTAADNNFCTISSKTYVEPADVQYVSVHWLGFLHAVSKERNLGLSEIIVRADTLPWSVPFCLPL